ncbi:MAG: ankyrin repeat domain-containing protein [Treponema sp.]|jgi:ankyrin repeat protein|nr:ankyrin repeat domain-containing protein [Treponema sp.]
MKRIFLGIIWLFVLPAGTIYADDYKLDLINALVKNDLQKIETILRANISTMSSNDKKLTMNFALNYSAGENTLVVCELLLKYNIQPTAFDLYTALNRNRQNNTIQFLLRNGAYPNGEILLLTMEKQRFDLAKQFIEAGVDVNYQYPLSKNYADGMTPLLYASKWGNFEIIKLLVERGANVNLQSVNGDTALSIARKNNDNAICNYLIERGAAEPVNNNTQSQRTGIANTLDNQIFDFQTGSYRLSGNNNYIKFSGNKYSGNINYVDILSSRSNDGFYRITGNSITITINGNVFIYRIDSNESFSGNGEVWVRIGN